jgi:hypothetical protein
VKAKNVADFISLINKWFELLNTYIPMAPIPMKIPYGKNLMMQDDASALIISNL